MKYSVHLGLKEIGYVVNNVIILKERKRLKRQFNVKKLVPQSSLRTLQECVMVC